MVATLKDVQVDETRLLKKGYSTKDLVDSMITINDFSEVDGDSGSYLTCRIVGAGLEDGKPFNTGSQNIVEKLKAAKSQGKLPIQVKVVKLGGNAFDIE